MTAVAVPFSGPAFPSWQHAHVWLAASWRLFRLAPLALIGLALLPIAFEGLWQAVPVAGVVVSKLLTPFASAWSLAMLDRKVRHGAFDARAATRRWAARLPALAAVAILSAGVFAAQLLVAAWIGGVGQAAAVAFGRFDAIELSRAQLAAVLASGFVPSTFLMFVMPRVLLDDLGVAGAVRESAGAVLRYWKAVTLLTALTAALLVATLWWPWMLLVLLPLGLCVGYSAYRDLFIDNSAD